jgi:hypothetical protein
MGGLNQPRNDASHVVKRGSACGSGLTPTALYFGPASPPAAGIEPATHLAHASALPIELHGNCRSARPSVLPHVSIIALLLLSATTAPAQPVNPLAIVIAQRDAAIRQRDALFAERQALRDERRETLRVCRQHGMPADADLPTWLGEVLREGSERWEWAKWFEQPGE